MGLHEHLDDCGHEARVVRAGAILDNLPRYVIHGYRPLDHGEAFRHQAHECPPRIGKLWKRLVTAEDLLVTRERAYGIYRGCIHTSIIVIPKA